MPYMFTGVCTKSDGYDDLLIHAGPSSPPDVLEGTITRLG